MRRTSSVVLVLVLVLIACGGSAETSTTTAAPTASTTTTTDGGPATTADEGNGGLPSGDCQSLSTTLSQASMLGLNPTSEDPGDTVQALQNMADAAPAEIADDLETLAAAYGDFLTALEEAGVDFADPSTYSSPAAQAALAAASQALNTAGVAEASANISAYIDSVCK